LLYIAPPSGNGPRVAPPAKPNTPPAGKPGAPAASATLRGRPVKKSVQEQVVDAVADHWLATSGKGSRAVRALRITQSGTSDLVLLAPGKGTTLVVARSWPHAAAFAHVVGQAIGDLAHLGDAAAHNPQEIQPVEGTTEDEKRELRKRFATDAAAGDVGILFAIGYTDEAGDEPIRLRFLPVIKLLASWLPAQQVQLWSVRFGDKVAIDKVDLGGGAGAKKKPAKK
jgi:hypothetical protein